MKLLLRISKLLLALLILLREVNMTKVSLFVLVTGFTLLIGIFGLLEFIVVTSEIWPCSSLNPFLDEALKDEILGWMFWYLLEVL